MNSCRPLPTEIYDNRASALGQASLNSLYEEICKLPVAPLQHPLSDANLMRYQVCIHVIGSLRAASEISAAVRHSWLSGRFLAASVLIRMLIELWGSVAYAEEKVLRKIERSELQVASDRLRRLLLGSRTGAQFRPGVAAETSTVNVMEFVRAANATAAGAIEDYVFLCDAAHPAHVPNTLLLFAGSAHDNWSNETFAANMHPILDRTLRAAESALGGIEKTGLDICRRCLPPILAETSRW